MLETLWSDARFVGRMLRKSPVFTIVAVLCISLGAGAVTTIYSAANALVLRPAPGTRDADRLARIECQRRDGSGGFVSATYPYYDYRQLPAGAARRGHRPGGRAARGVTPMPRAPA